MTLEIRQRTQHVQRKITDRTSWVTLNNGPQLSNSPQQPPPPPPGPLLHSPAFLHSTFLMSCIYLIIFRFSQYKHIEPCPDDIPLAISTPAVLARDQLVTAVYYSAFNGLFGSWIYGVIEPAESRHKITYHRQGIQKGAVF